jgi:pimeloyl-ACP methyl ester carboxylesterase
LRLATRAWGEAGSPLAVLLHGLAVSSLTWWRVGPWFAENGWHAVAIDLRGHGASPGASGDEQLGDLAEDVHETVAGLPGADGRIDVMLGHSLGALTALGFCGLYGDLVRRVVLEDPAGSESADAEETAREVEEAANRAKEAPDDLVRELMEENPSWAQEDCEMAVRSLRECDAHGLAAMRRGFHWNLAGLAGFVEVPALLVLGSAARGSGLPEPERSAVADALHRGTTEVLETGHFVHRDDFEGYVRLLGGWLGEQGA